MIRVFYIILTIAFSAMLGCVSAEKKQKQTPLADEANLLLGTDIFPCPEYSGNNSLDPDYGLYANEIVGPRMPSGMVSPSPVTSFRGVASHSRGSGYRHGDKYIIGFSQLNIEYNAYANPIVMPVVGQLDTFSGDDTNSASGYRVEKDSASEVAKPYYYTVKLKNSVRAEITATDHVGVHRYTFPKAHSSKILIDLGAAHKFTSIPEAWLEIVGNDKIEGYQKLKTFFNFYGNDIYFVAKFSRPFRYWGIWKDNNQNHRRIMKINPYIGRVQSKGNVKKQGLGAFVDYATDENEQIEVKIAVSNKSIEDARKKLEDETKGKNFDDIKVACENEWNKYFSKIQVEGGTQAQRTMFYTSVLRCSNFASVEDIAMLYTMNYQVLFLMEPKMVVDKIDDIVKSGYVRRGFFGNGFIPAVLSFYRRGATTIDIKSIYNKYYGLVSDPNYERYAEFIKYGYLPYIHRENGRYEMNEDCSNRTLGYSYEFYCLAELAKELGDRPQSETDFLLKHSKNYKNLFDPKTGFLRAKTADGKWVEPFNPTTATLRSPYNEGNSWQYSYMVLHDIPELVKMMGGKDAFVKRLDEFFKAPYTAAIGDVSGMIGCYTHGNGNDRFIPYLYAEVGVPHKTQEMVRFIMDTMYRNEPGALPNNDDYGNISGWYVMSAMGLYPPINFAAGDEFILGSPLFKKITLKLPEYIYGGNTFTIECENYAPENIYVESVWLDGRKLENFKMPISALKTGKKLVFKMSKTPVIK